MTLPIVLGIVGAAIGVVALIFAIVVNVRTGKKLDRIDSTDQTIRDHSHDIRTQVDTLIKYTDRTVLRLMDHTDQAHELMAGSQKTQDDVIAFAKHAIDAGMTTATEEHGVDAVETNKPLIESAILGSMADLVTGKDPFTGAPYRDLLFAGGAERDADQQVREAQHQKRKSVLDVMRQELGERFDGTASETKDE